MSFTDSFPVAELTRNCLSTYGVNAQHQRTILFILCLHCKWFFITFI